MILNFQKICPILRDDGLRLEDLQILSFVFESEYAEDCPGIAKELGMSTAAVYQRVKNLVDRGLVASESYRPEGARKSSAFYDATPEGGRLLQRLTEALLD